MREALQELKTTIRFLSRNPGNTVLSIIMLTFGLALTMYMFGAIDAYVLRPLPVSESKELMHIELSRPETGDFSLEVPLHDFLEFRIAQKTLNDFGAFYSGTINLSGDDRPERFDGAFMTVSVLQTLRVKPFLGRLFVPGEDQPGAQPVVILGYNLWRNRYQADQKIIGKVIRVNARDSVVVGVMPPDFSFPVYEQVWVPLPLDIRDLKREDAPSVEVVGRLKKNTSIEAVRSEFIGITNRMAKEFPDTHKGLVAVVKPFPQEYVNEGTRKSIYTMFSAVLLVLLIACGNVANLTLVRSIRRTREFAIRAALGEGKRRLIYQILSECTIVSLLAGLFAFLIAHFSGKWTIALLKSHPDMSPPYWVDFSADWRTVVFAVGVALVSGIVAGLFPALRTSRSNLTSSLHQGGYSILSPLGRASKIMLITQMILSCVLLISAGLMTRSVFKLDEVKIGADITNTLTGRIGLFEAQYPDPETRLRFFESLTERLSAIPGTRSAALTTSLPGTFVGRNFFIPDTADAESKTQRPFAASVIISPQYFSTFNIPLLQGRTFDLRDRKNTQGVVIVNSMLAEKFWKGKDPVGRRLQLGEPQEQLPWLTVVGVVADVLQDNLDDEILPTVYLPLSQNDTRFLSMALKTSENPLQFSKDMRNAVQSLDQDLPIYWLRTLEQWNQMGRFGTTFLASLFGIFAIVGIVLAAVGQYAVLAYTVGQRTREIGLRRALGALDRGVVGLFVQEGLKQFVFVLVIGLPFAMGFGRLLSNQLVGIKTYDPLTFGLVPAALLLVSVLAAMVPAARALKLDPAIALRSE